jgi:hypothetical protein
VSGQDEAVQAARIALEDKMDTDLLGVRPATAWRRDRER